MDEQDSVEAIRKRVKMDTPAISQSERDREYLLKRYDECVTQLEILSKPKMTFQHQPETLTS